MFWHRPEKGFYQSSTWKATEFTTIGYRTMSNCISKKLSPTWVLTQESRNLELDLPEYLFSQAILIVNITWTQKTFVNLESFRNFLKCVHCLLPGSL